MHQLIKAAKYMWKKRTKHNSRIPQNKESLLPQTNFTLIIIICEG